MNEPTIKVPVCCPVCAQEHLSALSTATVAGALLNGDCIRLACRCRARWVATDVERAQIRQYLAALHISQNGIIPAQ
jgi:hypothetical protein